MGALTFGFAAYDTGRQNVADSLAKAAEERGHNTYRAFPETREDMTKHMTALQASDVLILGGPSSVYLEVEMSVLRHVQTIAEREHRKLVSVIAEDTAWSGMRTGVQDAAPSIDAIFAATPGEQIELATYGYRNVRHTGYPQHWEKDYQDVLQGRGLSAGIKQKDNVQMLADKNEQIIVLVGGKSLPQVFNETMMAVRDACEKIGLPVILDLRAHPKELGRDAKDPQEFQRAMEERAEILRTVWALLPGKNVTTGQAIGRADMAISAGNVGSANSIGAALAGIPQAYVRTPEVTAQLKRQTGRDHWLVAEAGAMMEIEPTALDMIRFIADAHSGDRAYAERWRPEATVFTPPEDWSSGSRDAVTYLEQLHRDKQL